MSHSTTLPTAVVETILVRLTSLFLVGTVGDPITARQAAALMLDAYHPETSPEPAPKIERAVNLIQDTAQVAASAKASGQSWTQIYENRQRERRIASTLQRTEARLVAQAQANTATPSPHGQAMAPAM